MSGDALQLIFCPKKVGKVGMGSRKLARSEAMGLWTKPYGINHRLYGSALGYPLDRRVFSKGSKIPARFASI